MKNEKIKLDKRKTNNLIEIQPQVIETWLKKNQNGRLSNETAEPVMMTCWSPFG